MQWGFLLGQVQEIEVDSFSVLECNGFVIMIITEGDSTSLFWGTVWLTKNCSEHHDQCFLGAVCLVYYNFHWCWYTISYLSVPSERGGFLVAIYEEKA